MTLHGTFWTNWILITLNGWRSISIYLKWWALKKIWHRKKGGLMIVQSIPFFHIPFVLGFIDIQVFLSCIKYVGRFFRKNYAEVTQCRWQSCRHWKWFMSFLWARGSVSLLLTTPRPYHSSLSLCSLLTAKCNVDSPKKYCCKFIFVKIITYNFFNFTLFASLANTMQTFDAFCIKCWCS